MCDSNVKSFDNFTNQFRDYKQALDIAKTKLINYDGKNTQLGTYTIVTIGMGCCIYLRYNFKNKIINGYFLHNDNYGQYGKETNDYIKAINFISNYIEVLI